MSFHLKSTYLEYYLHICLFCETAVIQGQARRLLLHSYYDCETDMTVPKFINIQVIFRIADYPCNFYNNNSSEINLNL